MRIKKQGKERNIIFLLEFMKYQHISQGEYIIVDATNANDNYKILANFTTTLNRKCLTQLITSLQPIMLKANLTGEIAHCLHYCNETAWWVCCEPIAVNQHGKYLLIYLQQVHNQLVINNLQKDQLSTLNGKNCLDSINLTEEESIIIDFLKAGHTQAQIAKLCNISRSTIGRRLKSVCKKLNKTDLYKLLD